MVDVIYIKDDIEVALCSSNDRILVIKASLVPLKTTKSSQGVQVLKLKKDYKLKYMKPAESCGFADYKVYRTKNIPIAGSFVKDADKPGEQLTLF